MKKFLDYFKDISQIYHQSGFEKEISNYIVAFAKEHNLEYYQDKFYNVIIKKSATDTSKCNRTLGLQSHLDMVCAKDFDYDFDFKKDKIKLVQKNGVISGYKTSIGADNGVGVCIILEILASDYPAPNLEAIFTTNEETTMLGARNLNYKKITTKEILSLDGTNEGVVEISSASMRDIKAFKTLKREKLTSQTYQVSISGLKGGHSGDDIDKNRINAIKMLAEILQKASCQSIVQISGGNACNTIPNYASCVFTTDEKLSSIKATCAKFVTNNKKFEPEIEIEVKKVGGFFEGITKQQTTNLINYLTALKQGVLHAYNDGFPIASQNIGIVSFDNKKITITISLRSSSIEFEKEGFAQIKSIAKTHGFKVKSVNPLPYFVCDENSSFVKLLDVSYHKTTKTHLIKGRIHAGCEAGVFANNIKGLKMCITSPTLKNIHSPTECFEIESVNRTIEFLKQFLKDY